MVVRLLMSVLKAEALQAARHAEIGEICLEFSGQPSRVAAPLRAMKAQPGLIPLFTRAFETISQPVQRRHNSLVRHGHGIDWQAQNPVWSCFVVEETIIPVHSQCGK